MFNYMDHSEKITIIIMAYGMHACVCACVYVCVLCVSVYIYIYYF